MSGRAARFSGLSRPGSWWPSLDVCTSRVRDDRYDSARCEGRTVLLVEHRSVGCNQQRQARPGMMISVRGDPGRSAGLLHIRGWGRLARKALCAFGALTLVFWGCLLLDVPLGFDTLVVESSPPQTSRAVVCLTAGLTEDRLPTAEGWGRVSYLCAVAAGRLGSGAGVQRRRELGSVGGGSIRRVCRMARSASRPNPAGPVASRHRQPPTITPPPARGYGPTGHTAVDRDFSPSLSSDSDDLPTGWVQLSPCRHAMGGPARRPAYRARSAHIGGPGVSAQHEAL